MIVDAEVVVEKAKCHLCDVYQTIVEITGLRYTTDPWDGDTERARVCKKCALELVALIEQGE